MESLRIDSTKSSPEIHFNHETGIWELNGKSCPENVLGYYQPIFSWIKEYMETVNGKIELHVKLSYFNTSSSKTLLDLFEMLSEYNDGKDKVSVKWYYEEDDDDMLESGEEFSEDVDMAFEFIEM